MLANKQAMRRSIPKGIAYRCWQFLSICRDLIMLRLNYLISVDVYEAKKSVFLN